MELRGWEAAQKMPCLLHVAQFHSSPDLMKVSDILFAADPRAGEASAKA
jgi:hypothetical protein